MVLTNEQLYAYWDIAEAKGLYVHQMPLSDERYMDENGIMVTGEIERVIERGDVYNNLGWRLGRVDTLVDGVITLSSIGWGGDTSLMVSELSE